LGGGGNSSVGYSFGGGKNDRGTFSNYVSGCDFPMGDNAMRKERDEPLWLMTVKLLASLAALLALGLIR
jgi:hypothetical protein